MLSSVSDLQFQCEQLDVKVKELESTLEDEIGYIMEIERKFNEGKGEEEKVDSILKNKETISLMLKQIREIEEKTTTTQAALTKKISNIQDTTAQYEAFKRQYEDQLRTAEASLSSLQRDVAFRKQHIEQETSCLASQLMSRLNEHKLEEFDEINQLLLDNHELKETLLMMELNQRKSQKSTASQILKT